MYINLFDIYQNKLNIVIRIISYRYLQISSLIFAIYIWQVFLSNFPLESR